MDKVNDVLNGIKERVSSPLVFSFMFSWIFFNWPIAVALLWFDPVQLKNEGHSSIFSFIREHLNYVDSIAYPAMFAVAYTLLSPVFRNVINILHTIVDKRGDKVVLKISEDTYVPFPRFLQIKNESAQLRKELNDVFDKEKSLQSDFLMAQAELQSLRSELQEVKTEKSVLNTFQGQVTRTEIIVGTWLITSDGDPLNVQIISNQLNFLDKFGRQKEERWFIPYFFFDNRDKRLWFVAFPNNNTVKNEHGKSKDVFNCLVFELQFQTQNILVGTMNGRDSVRWEKVRS